MDSSIQDNIERIESTLIFPNGRNESKETEVLREHILTVIINEKPVMRLVCTKDHLKELVTGRLFTDRIINDSREIASLYFCRYETEASVFLDHDVQWDETIKEDKSCCTGNRVYLAGQGRRKLKKLVPLEWKTEWVFAMAERFRYGTKLHDLTQGTHSCILSRGNEIVFECEDIGRHNAIDKAVGYALLNGIPSAECIIYTSGRVPVDMAEKVIASGIPILASKSVPTAEACELAKEYGLTIISRAHTDSMEIVA